MIILQAFWFLLPAGISNMTPSLTKQTGILSFPMDFNATHKGKRVLGDHKTVRGFIIAPITGLLVFWIQQQLYVYEWAQSISLFNYEEMTLWFGVLLGAGAIIGDAIKSFFKRRREIAPGQSWIPFDQIDWTLGAIAFSLLVYDLQASVAITIILLGLALHPIFNFLGFILRIQKNKL